MASYLAVSDNRTMNIYKCHRFPPDIIRYAFWVYYRFNLSHRLIPRTIRRFITSWREWHSLSILRQCITPVMAGGICRLLHTPEERW